MTAVRQQDLDANPRALEGVGLMAAPQETLLSAIEDLQKLSPGVFPRVSLRDGVAIFDQTDTKLRVIENAPDLAALVFDVVRIEIKGVLGKDFPQRGKIGADHRAAAGERLDGRHAEALEARRHHHRGRMAIEIAQLLGGQIGEDVTKIAQAARSDFLSQRKSPG